MFLFFFVDFQDICFALETFELYTWNILLEKIFIRENIAADFSINLQEKKDRKNQQNRLVVG